MGKKSKKDYSLPEIDHGGCMWGLVSLLTFRHTRYTRKLLLDRKHGSSRYSFGLKHTNEKCSSQWNHIVKQELLDIAGNSRSENSDLGRSIRLFLEGEISKRQPVKKEIRLRSRERVSSAENNMQAVLSSNVAFRPESDDLRISTYSAPDNPSFQDVLERFSINLNLVALLQEFYNEKVGGLLESSIRDNIEQYPFMRIDCTKLDNVERETIQSQYILRKTLNEILEVFLCDKINDLKKSDHVGVLTRYEQSSNALDVISLNKELFLKFLQDPDSHLAKYIQHLQVSHSKKFLSSDSCKVLEDIKLLGNSCTNQHGCPSSSKQFRIQTIQNIFRKKDKNVKPSTESDNSQARNRIVVLNPMPFRTEILHDVGSTSTSLHSPQSLRASGESEGAAFHFSFRQIKKKMKQVIERKKEQHLSRKKGPHLSSSTDKIPQAKLHGSYPGSSIKKIPISGTNINSQIVSSNNNALTQPSYNVKISERKPILEDRLAPNAKRFSSMDRERYFQGEARKHIIEMLDFEYGGFHPSTKKVSRTLKKMLSSQESNSSAKHSPERHGNHALSPGDINLSPVLTPTSQNDTKQYLTKKYDLGGFPNIDKSLNARSQLHDFNTKTFHEETLSCSEESILKDGTESPDVEDLKDVSCSNQISVDTNSGTAGMKLRIEGDLSHPHLRLGVIEVDQKILTPSAPPGVLPVKSMEISECFIEKPNELSPISVLDTSFLDDCDSCRMTETVKMEPADLPVSPRNILFQEENDEVILTTDETAIQSCTDENLRFEYVRSLLQASGLASQESWWRWHSSRLLLRPSLYHQVDTPSGDFLGDLKLLFDCVNEVLEEIRCTYCMRMPWVSFIQPNISPFPFDEDLVKEVWKRLKYVNNSLLVNGTVDQIIGRDLDMAGWIDTRPNVDEIGVALEDEIWEDILEDIMHAL